MVISSKQKSYKIKNNASIHISEPPPPKGGKLGQGVGALKRGRGGGTPLRTMALHAQPLSSFQEIV